MERLVSRLATALFVLVFSQALVFAQTTGSIAGTVVDSNGAVVPGATVVIKGAAGEEFTTTTKDNGTYNVPAVSAGNYIVTVTAANFKKSVVENVKVDVGTPSTVNVSL